MLIAFYASPLFAIYGTNWQTFVSKKSQLMSIRQYRKMIMCKAKDSAENLIKKIP